MFTFTSRTRKFRVIFMFLMLLVGFFMWYNVDKAADISSHINKISSEVITKAFRKVIDDLPSNETSSRLRHLRRKKCSHGKDRVMFLKTHKTGGSTVTNILNRYGSENNLIFALPKHEITFDWPRRLKTEKMAVTWANPHVLCNHARYNKPIIRHLFPKEESIYITILREPYGHYESCFNYFELWKGLDIKGKDSMDVMEKYLQKEFKSVKDAKLHLKDRSRLLRNPMLYDLGLDFRYYQDSNAVRKYIDFLGREYDLVMMMEYFDESVVLLKRIMCWEIDDVVFIKHNERQKKDKKKLSPSLQASIKRWNMADFMLYDHFNKTFWQKIEEQGPDFYKDLRQLRKRKQEVYEMCVGQKPTITEIYHGKFVQGHSLKKDIPDDKKEFCTNLVKSELQFHKENMEAHKRRQNQIDDQGVFAKEFVEENDWNKAKDYAYKWIDKL